MQCPYCDSVIEENVAICPHCMAKLKTNIKVVQVNTGTYNSENNSVIINNSLKKKKSFIKYYIIIGVLVITFVILSSLIMIKLKPVNDDSRVSEKNEPPSETIVEKDLTLNTGVYSGKESPVSFGIMTMASISDAEAGITKLVDVMINRYLSDVEISEIALNSNQTLKEGFTFMGVEYTVYFHDLGYLGSKTLNPILQATILENKFFNDYFLVDGHYYKSDVYSVYNGPNIKNEESATVRMIYQVPIGQSHYICFGSDKANLGCFKG